VLESAKPAEGKTMFERLERSWSLVKASAAVLRENKSLMVLPVLSSISAR
jgi:hypothetical protein